MHAITRYVALYGILTLCPTPSMGKDLNGALKGSQGPVYTCESRLTACSQALRDAQQVIDDQDASITGLKKANKELADRLASSQSSPLLPSWAWLAIGAAAGITSYSLLHGH